jgi:hypothetical protein
LKHSVPSHKKLRKLKLKTLPEDSTLGDESNPSKDPNFRSELEYDGYSDIEESDNDEYSSDVEGKNDDRTQELKLEDRPEDESIGAEENVLNKQNNQKAS